MFTLQLRLISLFVAIALLWGCASPRSSIPETYQGPTATIRDSARSETAGRVDFFFVSEIDSTKIRTSLEAAREFSYGKGDMIAGFAIDRKVPARMVRLKLEGRRAYGAPIQEILNAATMFHVERVIELNVEPGAYYIVLGSLGPEGSEVWIEDFATRERVGKQVSP